MQFSAGILLSAGLQKGSLEGFSPVDHVNKWTVTLHWLSHQRDLLPIYLQNQAHDFDWDSLSLIIRYLIDIIMYLNIIDQHHKRQKNDLREDH